MTVRLNGKTTELPEHSTVETMLAHLGLANAPCAVEINTLLIPKARHSTTLVRQGDVVEVVTLVGGG